MRIASIFGSPWWNATPGIAFGLWLVLFPNSFSKFYTWLLAKSRIKAEMPKPIVIRIVGGLMFVLILITFYF